MSAASYRRIDSLPFEIAAGDLPKIDHGPRSTVRWLGVDSLVIDERYQRDILRHGSLNIVRIAREFEWAKFVPVVVAEVGQDQYAIVDGQHRATAAALRGLTEVPCMIIKANAAKQAEVFAAINGQVTAISGLQLHAARVAAKHPVASKLNDVCAAAGVSICRYPVPANKMKAGETLAAGRLYILLDKFGADILGAALSCITRTGDGNIGLVRAQIVEAFCVVLEAEPGWAKSLPRLHAALAGFDLRSAFSQTRQRTEGSKSRIVTELIDTIADHLDRAFNAKAA